MHRWLERDDCGVMNCAVQLLTHCMPKSKTGKVSRGPATVHGVRRSFAREGHLMQATCHIILRVSELILGNASIAGPLDVQNLLPRCPLAVAETATSAQIKI